MEFTKLIRRAGHEYRDAADELVAKAKLDVRAGRLTRLAPSHGGLVSLEYFDSGGKLVAHPTTFPLVVNCFGSRR